MQQKFLKSKGNAVKALHYFSGGVCVSQALPVVGRN